MLMPSTITALRTRRYDSTWYIPGTIHGSRMTLWMAADGTLFNRRMSVGQSAFVVQLPAALDKHDTRWR